MSFEKLITMNLPSLIHFQSNFKKNEGRQITTIERTLLTVTPKQHFNNKYKKIQSIEFSFDTFFFSIEKENPIDVVRI